MITGFILLSLIVFLLMIAVALKEKHRELVRKELDNITTIEIIGNHDIFPKYSDPSKEDWDKLEKDLLEGLSGK